MRAVQKSLPRERYRHADAGGKRKPRCQKRHDRLSRQAEDPHDRSENHAHEIEHTQKIQNVRDRKRHQDVRDHIVDRDVPTFTSPDDEYVKRIFALRICVIHWQNPFRKPYLT